MIRDASTAPKPIKTLHITNYYHPTSGGIRTFYRALLEAANRHRREMILVVPGPEDTVERVGSFARIYTIGAPRSPFFSSSYRLLLPHQYVWPYRSRLREILRQEQPDLIEVCDKYTLCFLPTVLRRGWISGVHSPVVVGLSCERMDDNVAAYISSGSLGHRCANWYMQRVYAPRFDGHISNSEYTAGELWDALGPVSHAPVRVCPMGVETGAFGPERRCASAREGLLALLPASAPASEATRVLLYVGRISPEKNTDLLLETMERLAGDRDTDWLLLIAGSGPRMEKFAGEAESRVPGRVHLLGQIAGRERLADIYANCDALIHPNPREPFGIAPLEAMASGLPVVAPRLGGVLTYANDANAWLAEPSGEYFAESVRQVFADERARRIKIEVAIRTAQEYSWAHVAARFFQLYDDLFARLSRGLNPEPLRERLPVL
ncbi:MAG: glycosyltransferase [Candidatus Acidiferrales bacterium]